MIPLIALDPGRHRLRQRRQALADQPHRPGHRARPQRRERDRPPEGDPRGARTPRCARTPRGGSAWSSPPPATVGYLDPRPGPAAMPPQDRRPRRPPPRRPAPRRPPAAPGSRAATRSRRIRVLTGVAVLLMCLLGARAAFLGTVGPATLADRGAPGQRAETKVLAQRGSILAADGTDLATDQLAVDVTASPNADHRPGRRGGPARRRSSSATPTRSPTRSRRAASTRCWPATWRPAAADRARALGLPGIYFSDTYQRFLPGSFQASQVIGLTGDTHEGLIGPREAVRRALTGTPGRRVEVRDLFGRPIQVLADREASPGHRRDAHDRPGDPGAHRERSSPRRARSIGAKSAMAIVMDPRDGAILAMATVPRFNPNDRADDQPGARAQPPGDRHLRAGLDLQDRADGRPRSRTGR